MAFHRKCGKRITLSNNNRTALRNTNEFNHGCCMSDRELEDGFIFEVRIDLKVFSGTK